MKEVIKNHPKSSMSIGVVLMTLMANFGAINDGLLKWYDRLFPPPANPDKTEWRKDWVKPESNVPDYVHQKDKTLFGIKADNGASKK